MSVVRSQARRRWCLVAGAVAVICAVPAVVSALPAAAPPLSAAQLRARVLASAGRPFQGYAQSAGALGIPSLPGLRDLTALLAGTTRMRIWQASASRWRVDVMSDAGERDTYQMPAGTFVWDSGAMLLTEVIGTAGFRLPRPADFTPPALAAWLLRYAGSNSRVSGIAAARVAGIGAAGLRVVPADPATTIGRVDIWADPRTGLPLRVEIVGRRGGAPALVSQFLQVSDDPPGRRVLTPARGPGTGLSVSDATDIVGALRNLRPEPLPGRLAGRARIRLPFGFQGIGVYGKGLSTFAVLPLPRLAGPRALEKVRKAGGVSVTFPAGFGEQISTPLLTVTAARSFVSDDTFLLAGLVDATLLRAAAVELTSRPDAGQ